MGAAQYDHASGLVADAAISSRLARAWGAVRSGLRRLTGRREPVAPTTQPSAGGATQSGWVPFDEQRRDTEFRRADIVFGPDMFDPRTDNGDRPLTDAMRERRSAVDPEDLTKPVGEVFGREASPAEIREKVLENARSIKLKPDSQP